MLVNKQSFKYRYEELETFLHQWYEEPDVQALYACLCVYQAHHWLDDPPIFLQLMGLPGSGKTELGIGGTAYFAVPKYGRMESELTRNSFLSGFGEDIGILPRLPKAQKVGNMIKSNGILLFPDFSTVTSKDMDEIKQIIGSLRRIYDGKYEKTIGNRGQQLQWEGKVTCIAACTPDIEDFWVVHRDMGERWLTLHWKTKTNTVLELMGYAEKATGQIGNKPEIKKKFFDLLKRLMSHSVDYVEVQPEVFKITHSQAILLEILRTPIKRQFTGRGMSVIGRGNIQMPTRTPQNLVSIARASASIRGVNKIGEWDLQLTKRICVESIPSKRVEVLKVLQEWAPKPISMRDLAAITNFSRHTLNNTVEDLRYLKVLDVVRTEADNQNELFTEESNTYDPTSPYSFGTPRASDILTLSSTIISLLDSAHVSF